MLLQDLFEASTVDLQARSRTGSAFDAIAGNTANHVAWCYGRMNPPTIGHGALLDKTAESGSNYFIFASPSVDATDNPLDYNTKIRFLQEMFPQHAQHLVIDPSLKNPLLAADWLYNKGVRSMTLVAGEPDIPKFQKMLSSWNSEAVRQKYNRQPCTIEFASSGEREDGAPGLEGVSATDARAAAKAADLKKFAETTGTQGDLAQRLYTAVRKGMGVEHAAIRESLESAAKLRDVATVKTNFPDADFWLQRSGSVDTVGKPSRDFNPDSIGIKVTATDVLDPKYLYYVFMHLHQKGMWKQHTVGALKLVHIRTSDVANLGIGSR